MDNNSFESSMNESHEKYIKKYATSLQGHALIINVIYRFTKKWTLKLFIEKNNSIY